MPFASFIKKHHIFNLTKHQSLYFKLDYSYIKIVNWIEADEMDVI